VTILTRYTLKEHASPFLYAFGALTGIMLVNQVARQFSNLIGKGLPGNVVLEVFALSVPFIVAMTLPMAVLVAVLHAFTRLGSDNEITALRASGVDLARLVRPALLAAAGLALFTLAFVDQVLPRSNHTLKTLLIDIARKKPTFELKEQLVNEVIPGQFFLRAGRIDQAADRLRDVVIYDLAREDRRRTIYADSGYMRFSPDRTDLHLTLFDGYVHDYNAQEHGVFRRVFFETDLVRVKGVSNTLQRSGQDSFKGDREMTLCELGDVVASDQRQVRLLALEWEYNLENDARALFGARPRPSADTARPAAGGALIRAYCDLLRRLAGVLGPDQAQAAQLQERRPLPLGGAVTLPTVRRPPSQTAARLIADAGGERLKSQRAVLESRRKNNRQHAAAYEVEMHKKLSIAASCLVFVLIGAPVGLRFPRGGVGLVIGASLVIFGFYYIGLIGGETLADQLIIGPFWAMWTPNLLMAAVGLLLFRRMGREHTARSSRLGSVLARLLPGPARWARGGRGR
jgi:lipopolysaccharide export system permease protein